ncbi:hypothetical protein OIO89_01115 (plasmid) [Mycobacterium ulcerans]|nr:hypothetical protein OIO89_01115 [Mycobacterium ulcerans]
MQDWLTHPDTTGTRLVIVTRHGVSTSAHDPVPDPAHAAVGPDPQRPKRTPRTPHCSTPTTTPTATPSPPP